jgi:ABC-type glycerol-3-phosphate transport system substrate-binding protein
MKKNLYVYKLALWGLLLLALGTAPTIAQDGSVLDQVSEAIRSYVIGEYQPVADLQGEAVTLDLTGWYNIVPQAAYEVFRESYPNITINFVDLGLDETHTRLLAALNAGTGAPCMSMIQDRDVPQFFDAGLVDLTDEIGPFQPLFPGYKWAKVVSSDGRVMGVPWEAGPTITYYRRSIFEEYAIDPTELSTWQGFLEAGQRLNEASNGEIKMIWSSTAFQIGGTQSTITGDQFMLSQQLGSGWFDADGNVIMDNEANIRAMKLLVEMRNLDITFNDPPSGAAEIASMVDGQVAAFVMAGWWQYYPKTNAPESSGDWGIQLMPAWEEGGPRGSNFGGTSMYITEQCEHPEHALEFLKFWLLRVQGRMLAYEAGAIVENVFLPTLEDSYFQQGDPFFGGDNFFEITSEAARQAPPIFEDPNFNLARSELLEVLPDILSGAVTVEEGMNRVANQVRRQIGQDEQPIPPEVPLFA